MRRRLLGHALGSGIADADDGLDVPAQQAALAIDVRNRHQFGLDGGGTAEGHAAAAGMQQPNLDGRTGGSGAEPTAGEAQAECRGHRHRHGRADQQAPP